MKTNIRELIIDREELSDSQVLNIANFAMILLGTRCNIANSINAQHLIEEVNKLSNSEKKVLINHYGLNGAQPKDINNFNEAVKVGIYNSPREIVAIEAVAFSKLRQGVIMAHYYNPSII